jgi:hypothetical protein
MNNNLKLVVVAYLKYYSIIFLDRKPTFVAKFDTYVGSRLGETEGFYGSKNLQKYFENIYKNLPNFSRKCRLLFVGSIVSPEFSIGCSDLKICRCVVSVVIQLCSDYEAGLSFDQYLKTELLFPRTHCQFILQS